MYRIEQYLDNFARCSFLREVDGDLHTTERDSIAILAREFNPENKVTRAWFLDTQPPPCDGVSLHSIPHRIVDPSSVVPGEPSRPADPTAKGNGGLSLDVLSRIRQQQIKQSKDLQHFTIFSHQWHQKDAVIAEQAERIKALESDNREFAERAASLGNELQQVRAELATLREEKSFKHKAKELWASIRNG